MNTVLLLFGKDFVTILLKNSTKSNQTLDKKEKIERLCMKRGIDNKIIGEEEEDSFYSNLYNRRTKYNL